ncbi:hypothetical protein [Bacillus alkalicellulosilyticus]|uniref:hypothetical protein n=1 Tax=Alkalihalobacterium alkalicellulosilyticum TaxID=1912214 RepID=UPI00099789EB|nr:hypothetical protein [Bacillus alkalicellulosilyticus]
MKHIVLFMGFLMILSACGGQSDVDENINIMLLSDIPSSFEERITEIVSNVVTEDKGLDIIVNAFPISHDKLTVEIVAKEVDIFIVEESLRHILLDSYGLTPLDQLKDDIPANVNYENYMLLDEETGDYRLYAVPLTNDSAFLYDLGIKLPTDLLAVIVVHSQHQELGMELLKELL